jgi:hypothetical protein
LKLEAVVARILDSASADDSPDQLAARGTAELLVGNWNAAVEHLTQAVRLRRDGEALNNLAAAHLTRCVHGGHCDAAARLALRCADECLAANPADPAALFNRALALELVDPAAAPRAWQACLQREASSPWRAEIRGHLARQ